MLWAALVALFGVLIYSAVSSAIVEPLPQWFNTAAKPFILPSATCFSICWCVVYFFSTLSVGRVIYLRNKGRIVALFAVSAVLNIVWQLIFFKGHFLAAATLGIFIIVCFKLLFLILLFFTDKRVAIYYLPIAFWYCFLCVLQYSFWLLNK